VNPDNHDQTMESNDDLQIADPFNLDAPDFMPLDGSPVLRTSVWYEEIPSAVNNLNENRISASVYPNPFNQSARLSIDLETESTVSVKIYDVTGTLVSTLVNERRGRGNHEFTISISRKGIYFADIMVNETRQVMKLVAQ